MSGLCLPPRTPLGLITLAFLVSQCLAADPWISALDQTRVKRSGQWTQTSFRRASTAHLATQQDGATLEFTFTGSGLMLTFDAHGLPFAHLGAENLGAVAVKVDDGPILVVHPQRGDRDVVLARGLPDRLHTVRLVHHRTPAGAGCRIVGFRILRGDEGELSFTVHGEANRFLTDVRAVLSLNGAVVMSRLVRNWMTGMCRIAGVAASRGYELEIRAAGWQPLRIRDIDISAQKETTLTPLYLERTRASMADRVDFPRMGTPAIVRPSESFATRVALRGASLQVVELQRHAGPARITRRAVFTENKALEYDGYAEGTIKVSSGTPPGLYDLVYKLDANGRRREQVSPRSVHVVADFPKDPVFLTFGHMDTFGQEAAEYLERIAELANLIAPDMVLVSNEVNAAYASGALSGLEMPHLITFGNHEVSGHEEWYGNAVSMTDFGPDLSILNFSHPWHGDLSHAYALLESRAETACKIINAFEHDAPVEAMLDRYRIAFLHEAHGPNPKVVQIGRTPTQRAGKVNSESFRVVRFERCRPVSFTYGGDKVAPIPFPRHKPSPLRVLYSPANAGKHRTVTAKVENTWEQDFPNGRVSFVMPNAEYTVDRGRIESTIVSDDGQFVVLSVRFDIPAKSAVTVTAGSR
ncbi:MAG: hypothetical protein WD696_20700 [Bryobacteraceae bacterium]